MFQFTRNFFRYNNKQFKRTITNEKFFTKENIPTIGLLVGVSALCFQTMILFPWHQVLSDQFNDLELNITKMEKVATDLNTKMDEVIKLEKEVKAKERLVLDSSEKILNKIEQTNARVDSLTE